MNFGTLLDEIKTRPFGKKRLCANLLLAIKIVKKRVEKKMEYYYEK